MASHGVTVGELGRGDLENLVAKGAKLVANCSILLGGLLVPMDVLAQAVEVDADARLAVVRA